MLVIEVDGFAYHNKASVPAKRDRLKDYFKEIPDTYFETLNNKYSTFHENSFVLIVRQVTAIRQ